MLDANGRPIKVGDWVATPYPRLADMENVAAEMIVALPAIIKGAILGKVIEISEDFQGEFVCLGDGIIYGSEDIVTLGGLEWVICPECGKSWPFDVRMNTQEECPFCEHLLTWDEMEWDAEMALHGGQLAEF